MLCLLSNRHILAPTFAHMSAPAAAALSVEDRVAGLDEDQLRQLSAFALQQAVARSARRKLSDITVAVAGGVLRVELLQHQLSDRHNGSATVHFIRSQAGVSGASSTSKSEFTACDLSWSHDEGFSWDTLSHFCEHSWTISHSEAAPRAAEDEPQEPLFSWTLRKQGGYDESDGAEVTDGFRTLLRKIGVLEAITPPTHEPGLALSFLDPIFVALQDARNPPPCDGRDHNLTGERAIESLAKAWEIDDRAAVLVNYSRLRSLPVAQATNPPAPHRPHASAPASPGDESEPEDAD
jgi:hypothetical protein